MPTMLHLSQRFPHPAGLVHVVEGQDDQIAHRSPSLSHFTDVDFDIGQLTSALFFSLERSQRRSGHLPDITEHQQQYPAECYAAIPGTAAMACSPLQNSSQHCRVNSQPSRMLWPTILTHSINAIGPPRAA